jgi:homoserine O-acetyltransferase
MEHIAKMMERNGQKHTYMEVESNYGHDAFLVELDKFEDSIKEVLKN